MTEDNRKRLSDAEFNAMMDNIVMMVDKDVIEKGEQANDVLKGCIVALESMGYVVPAFWPIIIWSGRCAYEEFSKRKEKAA